MFKIILLSTMVLTSASDLSSLTQQWIQFKLDYLKNYSFKDDLFRFDIFKRNFKMIEEHNKKFMSGLLNYKIGLNKFADLTKEEFIKSFLKLNAPKTRFRRDVRSNRTTRQAAPEMDWRQNGAVTGVKDQGFCGSCWSFSTTGSLESQLYLRTGNLVSLSEQNLIDCSVDQTNNGCTGGWMSNAFEYLKSNPITTEDVYSYQAYQQQCYSGQGAFQVKISGYQTIPPNEESLKEAVSSIGPMSAALDASNLQFYAGGVYRDDECMYGYVNHGVVVVGYGSEAGRDYWIVKNSWGPSWGENGYFRIIRNRNNQCSLATYGMYPIL